MNVKAIIAAGGRGERMGGELPKQFIQIKKKPVLTHTVEKFEKCDLIDEIVLVVPEDYISFCSCQVVDVYDFKKVRRILAGGKERQDSVYKALLSLSGNTDIVVIHDGVRPFISSEKIAKSIEICKKEKAVILALPINETVKRIEDKFVITTLDREKLWVAQTPQTFEYKLILEAYKKAKGDGFIGTDDSSLVERLGFKVKVLEGDYENIKITTPEDLILAEKMIEK
ncbi:MAG: 2-C-methyl-D-erythritol 4-phosphate cytidylyltransferase [candidate division Zixibacteria bacterium]|nr:2-C-methyl-D-erythritol 4-phosphate cytidylyltransferase [candidate division Zixibacteria bacterium]